MTTIDQGLSEQYLLTIGALLLVGLFASTVARRTFLPRVTILLLLGFGLGSDGVGVIPSWLTSNFQIIADITLLMVGFLLGGKLSRSDFKESTGTVLWISFTSAVVTALAVALGLYLLNVPLEIAVILGCVASATAPAAILDVVTELGVDSPFSKRLLSIVALDDIWALIIFALGMAFLQNVNGQATHDESMLVHASLEIFGSILLGFLMGLPAAYLTGRAKPGQPMLTEAIGIVFICGGVSMWLDMSYLITSIVLGATIVNLAQHHEYPFHAIEDIESPFMVIFFILAGASLELDALMNLGLIGSAFILLRIMGKYLGAKLGGRLSHADSATRQWMGIALLPQAGVAIGMALVASHTFHEHSQTLLTIAISSTIFFEIIGPIGTRLAIQGANHIKQK